MKKFLFVFVFVAMVLSPYAHAKKDISMDMTNPSVQLLKKLNDEGAIVRQNDVPINKAYTEEDTARVENLKKKFHQDAYGNDFDKKIPDNK